MIGDNILVAIQAFLHRRQPGMNRAADIGVAELALYGFDTGMDPVAERDRLLRTDPGCRRHVKKVAKSQNQKDNESGPKQRDLIFCQRRYGFTQGSDKHHGFAAGADNYGQNQNRCQGKGGDQNFHQITSPSFTLKSSGNRFRKNVTAIAINAKNPTNIKPSAIPRGSEETW